MRLVTWAVALTSLVAARAVAQEAAPATTSEPAASANPTAAATIEPVELPPIVYIDVGAGTAAPLMFGLELTIEDRPDRFLFQLQLGYMPTVYVDLINTIAVDLIEVYPAEVGELIQASLDTTGVTRLSFGWRPWESAGFEMYGGYTALTFGGGIGTQTVAEAVGAEFEGMNVRLIPLDATIHALHFALGWRFMLSDRWVLRTSLAYLQIVGAEVRVNINSVGFVESVIRTAEQFLSDLLEQELKQVFSPVLSLTLSYRL